jgi:rod shape determining protein RodA
MHRNDFVRQLNNPGGDRRPSRILNIDFPLLFILIALCSIGLAVLYSASAESIFYVKRQATFMLIGLFAMIVIAQFQPRLWERWSILIFLCGLLSLVAVLFFGVGAKGAQRWLDLGVTRFQPSELMKIAVPMALASYLGKRHLPPRFKHVSIAVIATLIPVLLVARQPDLGTSLIIFSSGFFALFLAGLGLRYLIFTALVAIAAIPTMWFYVMLDYQKQRVLTLLSPEQDKLGAGWNIMQSTTAIGSGGLSGKGWTLGTQSQLNFLPESHTDFIIAVLAEEFGLIGVLGMLLLYLLLIGRCMLIALNAQSMFGRIMAGTISLTFFVYIFVNMGMVSGILPVVGAPLPFISYGGTAIVTLFLGFGILMAISTEPKRI